jgi:putative ABC transport system permease protein
MTLLDITPIQLALCLVFIVIAGGASILLKLDLQRDLAIGTVRTVVQLLLVGYVLTVIFDINNPFLVILLYMWMIFWAAHAIRGRVKEKTVKFFMPTYVAMTVSYLLITIVVTGLIIQVDPWYKPQYFIPLGGMIIGNSMNSIAIALDRMFSEFRRRRGEIELSLIYGATSREATESIVRDSIRAGMIPSINALMTVGLVSLPGMMTGQILAGADPLIAVKYQIIVMLMIIGATAIGCMLIAFIIQKRCFSMRAQLILR